MKRLSSERPDAVRHDTRGLQKAAQMAFGAQAGCIATATANSPNIWPCSGPHLTTRPINVPTQTRAPTSQTRPRANSAYRTQNPGWAAYRQGPKTAFRENGRC